MSLANVLALMLLAILAASNVSIARALYLGRLQGRPGPIGMSGEDGEDGRDGKDGAAGRDGVEGKDAPVPVVMPVAPKAPTARPRMVQILRNGLPWHRTEYGSVEHLEAKKGGQ